MREGITALKLLAEDSKARNQVWHLPTANPGLTAIQWVKLIATEYKTQPRHLLIPKWAVKLIGCFDRTIGEAYEMLYQQEIDYHFDSSKFNAYFNFTPTSYEQGIRETIEFLKSVKS